MTHDDGVDEYGTFVVPETAAEKPLPSIRSSRVLGTRSRLGPFSSVLLNIVFTLHHRFLKEASCWDSSDLMSHSSRFCFETKQ